MASVLVAHPSPDVYGSDLQLIESVTAMTADGMRVSVSLPAHGPLEALLTQAGASVSVLRVPVLRRAVLRPAGLVAFALATPLALVQMIRAIRRSRADVVYVNTVTIPLWLLAARLAGRRALCHVHEAEEAESRLVRIGLNSPILLATTVVTNSKASARALWGALPRLRGRTVVLANGVPESAPSGIRPEPGRIALVARLSPRKGIDVALDAVGVLRRQGREVHLQVCGTAFEGYEWFEQQLRERAALDDLAGTVTFSGYVNPTRPVLDAANIVLVPSRVEPFGNTAVEAMLAGRPLIASDVQGLAEIVDDGRTGLLVRPGDPSALASAIALLLDDPEMATQLAHAAQLAAREHFGVERYRREISAIVSQLALPAA
jgi:glycosyltransferase involved in cell wall biosynthesis